MRPVALKSAVQNAASNRILKSDQPAVPANASQILVLSDAWVEAHTTALARAEMNLDKVLRGSDHFLKSLMNLASCVYAMPSGTERYQYPFALGMHFELKQLIQHRQSKRDDLEQHLSQIRQERARFADMLSMLNKRADLKAQILSSFKHVYNPRTKTLEVFMSISASLKDQWEVTQVVDGLQKLEIFKSRFLSQQFADTKDYLWDWCDCLAQTIDAADSATSQQLIEIESEMEADYVRKHLRAPGDEIWLPSALMQYLETQKGERHAACVAGVRDHLIKAHGAKALKDVDIEAVVQDEQGFGAATDSFFRRLCLLKNASAHLREALDHLHSMLHQYKQLLEVQLLLYRLPRAASAPSVALETAITTVINQVTETSAAIVKDVEKLVQGRSDELWAPFIRVDAVALATEKVVEQMNSRGDIAYYRAKIAELEQSRESLFGTNHEKIGRNRLKLGEIQRDYKGESDDLRSDFAHIEVVCKEYYRAFELNLFDALDRVLAPLSKTLRTAAIPGLSDTQPRQIRSANNSRIDRRPTTASERPASLRSSAVNPGGRKSEAEPDNRLSRISTSIRNMRARDVQLANARASRRPPPLQPPEQLLHDCLEACDMFTEVHSKITATDFQHIQFSKMVEGSNLTGRFVEWLCVRRVGRDASQSAQALQGGVVLAINAQSIVGVPVHAAEKMLDDIKRSSGVARLVVRHRRNADDAFTHYLQRTLNGIESELSSPGDFKIDFRIKCWQDRAWTAVPTAVSRQLILATVAVKTNNTTSRLSTNFRSTMKTRPTGKAAAPNKAHTMKPNPAFEARSKASGQQQQPQQSHTRAAKDPARQPEDAQAQQRAPYQPPAAAAKAQAASRALAKGPKPPPMKRPSAAAAAAAPEPQANVLQVPAIDLLTPSKSMGPRKASSAGTPPNNSSQKNVTRRGSTTSSSTTPAKTPKKNFLDPAVEAALFENADLNQPKLGSPHVRSKSFVKPVVADSLPAVFKSSLPPTPPPPPIGTPPAPRPGSHSQRNSRNRPPNLRPPSDRVSSIRSNDRQPSSPSSIDSARAGSRTSSKIGSLFGRDFSNRSVDSNGTGSGSNLGSPSNRSRQGSKRLSKRESSKRASTRVNRANVVLAPPPITTKSNVLQSDYAAHDDLHTAAPGHHRRDSSLAAIRATLETPESFSSQPRSRNNSLTPRRESDTGTFVFGATGPIEEVAAAQSIDSVLRSRAQRRKTTLTPPPQPAEDTMPIPTDIVSTPIWQRRRRSSLADTVAREALSKPNA